MRPVLELRVHQLDITPTLTAVCPGYEEGAWRDEELARDTFDRHLASFALKYSEFDAMRHGNAAPLLRKAAKAVYATEKYSRRGEFGELLLHAISRDIFGSQPAISKITFKDGPNETVKGFDEVHVVEMGGELELWLGEVKFYDDLARGIRDVTAELADHLATDYLRGEFVAIMNKLDPSWPHAERVARLLDENTSLDEIFDALTIPVLLTYDSPAVAANQAVCAAYVEALQVEATAAWEKFAARIDPAWNVRLRLLLLPLHQKKRLVELMQGRLRAWQQL